MMKSTKLLLTSGVIVAGLAAAGFEKIAKPNLKAFVAHSSMAGCDEPVRSDCTSRAELNRQWGRDYNK